MLGQIECLIDNNILIFDCPHCQLQTTVAIDELACCIFRHGAYRVDGNQINPHESKENCEMLVREDKVVGCCKPFRIEKENRDNKLVYKVMICDYI